MEVFQLNSHSWFLPRELFLSDPLLSTPANPVLCHILTGALASSLTHCVSALNYEQNLRRYLSRFRAAEGVLRVYNVTVRKVSRSEAELEVLCERLCFRVETVFNFLSVEEQLYLIAAVIRTAQVLAETFGFFAVRLAMLGLDKNGELRMWINSNHAENSRELELDNEQQQFASLLQLFSQLKIENRQVNSYLQNFRHMGIRFKDYPDYHVKFMRLHHLQLKERVSVESLAQEQRSQASQKKDFESCPTTSLKLTNESIDLTTSIKENSLNSKFLLSRPKELCKSSDYPHQFNTAAKNRMKGSKQNRKSIEKNGHISLKSSFCNIHETQEGESPAQYLATRARLQQSFQVEDNTARPISNIGADLMLLGKMGKLCESMTTEQLILEEFKFIYQ